MWSRVSGRGKGAEERGKRKGVKREEDEVRRSRRGIKKKKALQRKIWTPLLPPLR